jgi:hypothetical protein
MISAPVTTVPTDSSRWLSTRDFARLAGIDPRSAARICRQAAAEKRWCNATLAVRRVKGRGGRAGIRYEVLQDSLPHFLVDRDVATIDAGAELEAGQAPAKLRQRDKRAREARRRRDILQPILATDPNSNKRAEVLEEVAHRERISPATLYRWLNAWQVRGLSGLAPSLRTRTTKSLVVSRAVDGKLREAGVSEDAIGRLKDEVDQLIKVTWASQLHFSGMSEMARHIGKQIRLYCETAKFPVSLDDYAPSPSRIRQFREYRIVGIQAYDKETVANLMPRIRRTYDSLAPMSVVFVDVKFADIYVNTAKGERGRPILVAFYDAATRRIFSHLQLLTKGGGATRDAVGSGLSRMLMHADWGVPDALYTDNGSEMLELDEMLGRLALTEQCRIIRATPRNPQAKPIEGVFANLNRLVFSKMGGFTGGKARTMRHVLFDKARPIYPGSWKKFVREFTMLMDDYHQTKRSGPRSPQKLYLQKCRDMAHKPRVLAADQLALHLGEIHTRRVRQGSVQIGPDYYTCPKLYEVVGDERVTVVVPPDGIGAPVMVFDGEVFDLERDEAYAPLDPAGALESERRKNAYNGASFRRYIELGGRTAHPADRVRLASHWLARMKNAPHPVSADQDPHQDDTPQGRENDRQKWWAYLENLGK